MEKKSILVSLNPIFQKRWSLTRVVFQNRNYRSRKADRPARIRGSGNSMARVKVRSALRQAIVPYHSVMQTLARMMLTMIDQSNNRC